MLAQTNGSVSIIVIDLGGKLLPIEQFKSDTREGCPLGGGALAPHFRTRSGGPAIAIDLTEVADPNRSGCGYGLVQTGAADSAMVRIADLRPAELDAWNAKTGLSAGVVGTSASPPRVNELVPTPSAPEPAGWATGIARILMIVGAALAAGLLVGALVYRREQRRARGDLDSAYSAYPEPGDAPLDEHHAGMLTMPEVIAPPQEEAVSEDDAPPEALDDESPSPTASR